ncbi:transmembrane protein, putative (macronuclear) [Tetrahymena thermophila SB210]|uniref:Transmembrane protein, putative n=1 Tax=Tetrahymena thermophila (strain SB210) TaxID=312017 RepID=W7XC10_TETTS|nr:transmembrane protein, putative [Tetrahymena thermophila SB210]EWS74882.1 transmembrane protein, putative [Tetrahymena thermophila SB210]|eukprot:XP_012652595.1 transmembrane protein, putative [Tetrahymena thermophila SB210]
MKMEQYFNKRFHHFQILFRHLIFLKGIKGDQYNQYFLQKSHQNQFLIKYTPKPFECLYQLQKYLLISRNFQYQLLQLRYFFLNILCTFPYFLFARSRELSHSKEEDFQAIVINKLQDFQLQAYLHLKILNFDQDQIQLYNFKDLIRQISINSKYLFHSLLFFLRSSLNLNQLKGDFDPVKHQQLFSRTRQLLPIILYIPTKHLMNIRQHRFEVLFRVVVLKKQYPYQFNFQLYNGQLSLNLLIKRCIKLIFLNSLNIKSYL